MTFVVVGLIAVASREASAQMRPWEDRVFMRVGFGVESGDSTVTDARPLTIYEETGSTTTTSNFTSGSLFDVAIGFRVYKNFSVGASYHQEENDADSVITGTAPHPIFFNQPRSFTATETALERKENAVHLQFGYTVPVGTRLDFTVFGGPSFFRLQQDVISNVTIAETSAAFTQVAVSATRATRKKNATGYNVGVDVAYMAWENDSVRLGAGAFVRYALAKADVLNLQTEQSTDIGGLQIGFGGRIRF